MENMRLLFSIPVFASLFAISTSGCGKEPLYRYDGPGTYDSAIGEAVFPGPSFLELQRPLPDLTPEEREGYCLTYVPQETDVSVREELLRRLQGRWRRQIRPSSNDLDTPFGASFEFDFDRSRAWLQGAFLEPSEEIIARRICLSKPLEIAPYAGFRILELQAGNNEGVAAFAFRFAPTQGRFDPLWMTERHYERWGQGSLLIHPESLLKSKRSNERSARIWVYPERN